MKVAPLCALHEALGISEAVFFTAASLRDSWRNPND